SRTWGSMSRTEPAWRVVQPPEREIIHATDLGGVGVLKHGDLYLLTDPFGDIHPSSRGLGLYHGDTRVLSCAAVTIDGARPALLRGDTADNFRSTIQLTNADMRRNPADKMAADRVLARQSLGITRHRVIDGALRERLVITNFTEHQERLTIELSLGADGADIFEVRGYQRERVGTCLPIVVEPARVVFGYRGLDHILRRTQVAFTRGEVRPADADGPDAAALVVRWRRTVEPGTSLELSWTVWADELPDPDDTAPLTASPGAPPAVREAVPAAAYRTWLEGVARVATDYEPFDRLIGRSVADLRLLLDDGPGPGEHYLAAGVPWFTTLFGRDALIAAYESIAMRPALAVATLEVLAARQATADDPSRDANPGKMLHELRTGEMAHTGELPFGRYYGTVDATPLWLILLAETFAWTGDMALVDRLWPHALAALEWIDRYGDLDGDGFVEYQRRAPLGLLNQGWKDSSDSVRDRDGRPVEPPIALAEVQGYVHEAKTRLADLARRRGDGELAVRLDREAAELRTRFEAAFWMEDAGYYAMALGRDKQPAGAITSNVGQALWGGIISPARARAVVRRLAQPDIDSGWGIRTYAAGQPGYNPLGYHTGSVWPHDNALIVAGMKRYGFDAEAADLASRIFEAARHFPDGRMPELFCGFARHEVDVPVPYPVACSPQAWSAAAPLQVMRTMLGIRASAAEGTLELVRPHLPTWLGKLTLRDLRIGQASVDLLFHRWRGATSAEVLRKSGRLEVTIRV
ncbi:MAG TPA: glycogen debranching N-terminal domain-containing protein, partial [Candidatus Sulfotelmatobacter sp.]|nr:glycogen debranching N-terminal domain-containing protein [Candidatus Sulfotelmatobacter sp.]